MKVRYLSESYDDLDEIWDYLVRSASERTAIRLTDLIVELASGLTVFPHRHEAIPLLPEDLRVLSVDCRFKSI